MFSLQNKIALITGGASGIGLAITEAFAQAGATVHILELNRAAAQTAADAVVAAGGQAFAHEVNVADQLAVRGVVEQIAAQNRIDILVNNAGIAHIGNAETTIETDFDRVISVNVKGVYNCLNAVLPHMRAAGGGVILNMASIAATLGLNDRFAYSMSKGATVSMTLSVAKDYLAHNIRCNCISPARVHTPFVDGFIAKNYPGQEAEMVDKLAKAQPIGRMGTPQEVAALALFLCSDEAGFITGCDYPIDGGTIRLNT
ncbi:short-chain dehydrogenase/reductase SDR [Fibrella aestuarina BUZ 2]|uniref:Short-chain dehydrogenase/reductase SDR n=1 Tax=Fibrella aestuarina BUZ 2 TaxID=1166018 RepID=I0KE36_9BACT|nr:SDR family oxidoreductase [Fibrella aestuarina]CCH02389.1 short-chain dehydrogenase/reductase SDR [Fibrella aestuarina BUZ 2]